MASRWSVAAPPPCWLMMPTFALLGSALTERSRPGQRGVLAVHPGRSVRATREQTALRRAVQRVVPLVHGHRHDRVGDRDAANELGWQRGGDDRREGLVLLGGCDAVALCALRVEECLGEVNDMRLEHELSASHATMGIDVCDHRLRHIRRVPDIGRQALLRNDGEVDREHGQRDRLARHTKGRIRTVDSGGARSRTAAGRWTG